MPGWFEEMKQRRVFRALIGYGIVSFAILQIIEPIMHGLGLPEWVLAATVIGLGLGFPLTLVLAWVFDVNAGRIESAGSRPRAGLLLLLIALGIALAAPGVAWYLVLRPQARGPSAEKALRAALDAVPPASEIRAAPSIAVLPLVNMSKDPDQEYFADGLAEELLNLLAKVPGLRVAARTSAFAFKGKNEDVSQIGQKLHVAHVLEGSVRRSGDQVRITTQLINASDGFHVWSETYNRKLADVFAVQDEIARAVVAALKLKLLPDQSPTTRDQRTANPEVYNQFLLGRQIANQANPTTMPRAVATFEKALALDPGYAPAWAGLSNALLYVAGEAGGTLAEIIAGYERALAAAEKAVALAPELADAHVARGRARVWARLDWDGGRVDLEHALALNPSDAAALRYLAEDVLMPPGRLAEAIAVARKATDLDPLSSESWTILGWALAADGRLVEAREIFGRALGISPGNDQAGLWLGLIDLLEGRPERALERFTRLSTEWCRMTGVALAQHDLGHQREAQKALDKLQERHAEDGAFQLAEVHSRRGEKDRAMDWLERALAQRDSGLLFVKRDPFLSSLRGDPRYTALLAKMKLPPD